MKNIALLLVVLLALAGGCAKKAEEVSLPQGEFEQIITESETITPSAMPKIQEGTVPVPKIETKIESVETIEQTKPVTLAEKPTVEQIQKALQNAGLYTGKIDGIMGSKTKKAILDFQAQNGLKADGKVGPKTWEKLGAFLNKAQTGAAPKTAVY